jgi:hypothetical protein
MALHDLNDEGNFKWCMGNYSLPLREDGLLNFAPGAPNNWDSFKSSENCAELFVAFGVDTMLQINDASCDKMAQFICEVKV